MNRVCTVRFIGCFKRSVNACVTLQQSAAKTETQIYKTQKIDTQTKEKPMKT